MKRAANSTRFVRCSTASKHSCSCPTPPRNRDPGAGLDQLVGAHIAAAAGRNHGSGCILSQILEADAAGGHDLEHGEGSCHGLDLGQAAALLGGEELQHFQAQTVGGMIVGGGGAAGEAGDALFLAVFHDLNVQTGGDDELAAGGNGLVHHLGGQHRAGVNAARRDQSRVFKCPTGLSGIPYATMF